jgi:hypothetical protein
MHTNGDLTLIVMTGSRDGETPIERAAAKAHHHPQPAFGIPHREKDVRAPSPFQSGPKRGAPTRGVKRRPKNIALGMSGTLNRRMNHV